MLESVGTFESKTYHARLSSPFILLQLLDNSLSVLLPFFIVDQDDLNKFV